MPEYQDDPGIAERQQTRNANEHQEYAEAMTAKAFLIARTHETVKVPITSTAGVKEIEIRARLSRIESDRFRDVIDMWSGALKGDEAAFDDADDSIAEFLAYITTDPELDKAFWLSEELDNSISNQILLAYFIEPFKASRRTQLEKFRKE